MATQALDTNDMQQVTFGRTLNTATRIPQALLDRRQQEGQFANFQAPSSVVRNVQQPSGSAVGQFFRNQQAMPVYSAQRFRALPQNVYDWNNAQWARYFGSKGPSNTWDQDTWKMFQMVSSYSPEDWHSRRKLFGMAPMYFDTEYSPSFYNLENLPQSPYQKMLNEQRRRDIDNMWQKYKAENSGWAPPSSNDWFDPYWEIKHNLNPGAKGYHYGQRQYMAAAKNEIEREMALQRAYASLEKYAAQKNQDRFSVDKKNGLLLQMYQYMKNEPQKPQGYSRGFGIDENWRGDVSQYNFSPSFEREGKKEAPRTMEQVREFFGGTPMLDAGYSLNNLPQYNPSFIVKGVAKFTDENKKPWVNTYIKKEVNKQKAAGDYHVNKPMSESGIQGVKPQSEMLSPEQNRWRKFI